MSNNGYEIRRDFLVATQWDVLPAAVRQKIEELASDPRPEKYGFQRLADSCKISVPDGDEDIVVLYEIVESDKKLIDLMEIRRTGPLNKNRGKIQAILDFIRKLLDFRP